MGSKHNIDSDAIYELSSKDGKNTRKIPVSGIFGGSLCHFGYFSVFTPSTGQTYLSTLVKVAALPVVGLCISPSNW